jgi:hypothetical protein
MWLNNRGKWSESDSPKWESMALERCVASIGYEVRLVPQGIYEGGDVKEARKLFGKWSAQWVYTMREQTRELL